MSVPYNNTLMVASDGGQQVCIELPAPPRGFLQRLIVKQTEGALGGFTFNIYDREQPCADSSLSVGEDQIAEDDGLPQGMEPELHKVIAEVTIAGGTGISEQFGLGAPYVNQDDQDQRRTPTSRLHMQLDPGGGDHKVWQIAYTITTDMG
jgi:hypothetical protein